MRTERLSARRLARCLTLLLLAVLIGAPLALARSDEKKLGVVATIPDLAYFARLIGGERVTVRSLSKGTENLHAVPVRPSMLIALSKADLFLEMGLSLEAAWLPELLIKSGNDKIQVGSDGFVNCSAGYEPIDVPKDLSRREGHLHPEGNPHYNLDPHAGPHLARQVHAALVAKDPQGKRVYDEALAAWLKEYELAKAGWDRMAKQLKGKRLAVYHVEYDYLVRRYEMKVVAAIEPKPGIPPTPGDIARTIEKLRKQKVPVILTAAWSNNRSVTDISRKTGATVLELPNQVRGAKWATGWLELMNGVHARLFEAYGLSLEEEPR